MPSTDKKSGFFDKLKSVFLGPEEEQEIIQNKTVPAPEAHVSEAPLKESPVAPVHKKDWDTSIKPMAVKKVVGYEDPHKEPITSGPVYTPEPQVDASELDVMFAENFTASGGKFIYCESKAEMVDILKQLKQQNGWRNVYYWEDEVKEMLEGHDALKISIGCTLETSQAAVSLCEYIIAMDGSIILSSKQASTRGLSVFPAAHIIVADRSRLVCNLNEGIKKFNKIHGNELPFAIYLSDKFSADTKPSSTLVLNAHGTHNIYLLYVDESVYKED